ncbi:MAG TPA: MBG domain-containing protein [Candidatus Angelobacter sp.]|jgi:6-phosphogluconolactonase (cycloisomerase 2 family)
MISLTTKNCFTYLRKAIGSRGIVATILLLIMALALPANLAAQSFVYVNNQDTTNTVSGFLVGPTGALSPIAGSPFATGGAGSTVTCYGLDRMVVSMVNNLLFVSNSGDQTISVFQVAPTTGVLTIAPGSPVNSGLAPDACGGMSLAVTPDGQFLMASSGGQIQSFNVAASGALTPAVLTTRAPITTVGMKISSDGKYLAISNERSITVYNINLVNAPGIVAGSLTPVAGSPFTRQSTGLISGLAYTCAVDTLYASESSNGASAITDAWSVAPATGALTPVAGSPFLTPGTDSNVIALNPDDSRLFISDQFAGTITSFNAASGSLTKIGTYGGPGQVHVPTGLAVDTNGAYLYVADDTYGIAVFSIALDGSLTLLSDTATMVGQAVQGVVTYPTRSCVTADLGLGAVTATPATVNSGSTVQFDFQITNTSTSTSPAQAVITYNLPAGLSFVSCSTGSGTGVCSAQLNNPHTISFPAIAPGGSDTVTVVAQSDINLLNGTPLTTTFTITNKSVIDANATNDSTSSTITIAALPGDSTLTVSPASAPFNGTATLSAKLAKKLNDVGVSGRTVSFSLNGVAVGSAVTNSSGIATVSASIAGIALGTYPGAITTSFLGDSLFNATTGTGTLSVTTSVLTVVPTNITMTYGSAAPASYPYTFTGFVNGDTSAVVSGTATCTAVQNPTTPIGTSSPVGNYPITCTITGLSAANYTFITVPGTLTIAPAPITVVVNDATRLYGDPNVFTTVITGAQNGETVVPTFITSAQVTSPVGNYVVVPQISGNYVITSATNGTLTILPAPLSLVINSADRKPRQANPPFTGILTGIKNADPITPIYSTTAVAGSPVGTYPITATFSDPGFKLGNYTVSITNGTLTITRATLVISAANAGRLYGSANPVFTGTITGLLPGDSITATYASAATAASPVGDYPIVPTPVDPLGQLVNYTVSVVNGDLTVSPAPLTVTINNASRVYGSANPALSGTISGLKNGDSITATYSSVGVTVPVGTYQITPTFTDPGVKLPNYTVSLVGGTLTVTPAALTVTAVGGSRVYGGVNPAATISGLKNGDNITATYTTPTSASPVGTYTLTPVLVDPNSALVNYTVTTRTATLTITKAPLTIAADSVTVVLNTTKPFTATFTGLVLGQAPSALTGTLNCTAAVNTVGTHTITCSGVSSTNYTITFATGTATVHYAGVNGCNVGLGRQILAPIADDGSTIFTRATTTTIPVQFRVCDASGASVSTAGVVSTFRLLRKITGATTTNLNQGQSNAFTFDAVNQDWLFNLNTSNPTNLAAGSTYVYQITLNDGTSFNFQFSMI